MAGDYLGPLEKERKSERRREYFHGDRTGGGNRLTRDDTVKVMSVLRGAYPQFYRGISKQEALDTLNLWTSLFSDDDPALVAAAVKSFVEADEKGFPPTPGQIKGKLRLLVSGDEMTEAEAWGLISAAVRNSLYGAQEEFEKLPPFLRRLVGSPSQLREWGMMDSATLHSVVASNFQRSYKAVSEREKEFAKLPSAVKELVSNLRCVKGPEALPAKSQLEGEQ